MKKYMITCATDPYHASHCSRHRGQKILKYDGPTPIKWVHDDGYGYGYTLDEARKILMQYARDDDNTKEHKYFDMYYNEDIWKYKIEPHEDER